MTLDERVTAPTLAVDALPRVGEATPARSAAPASLVLFVGTAPASPLCDLLAHDGMRCLWLAGPAQALRAAALARFDAVVIDAAQLGSHAAGWIAELQAQLRCPLIVVADHADEVDEIVALELGADAYLARPLAARRLRAHLAALMRQRQPPSAGDEGLRRPSPAAGAAGWRLDRVANQLFVDGRGVALTEVQGALLQCLIEAQGRIVPRARLATALRHGHGLSARSVDVYIHRLRSRLREAALEHRVVIAAVRGRGYSLGPADNAVP